MTKILQRCYVFFSKCFPIILLIIYFFNHLLCFAKFDIEKTIEIIIKKKITLNLNLSTNINNLKLKKAMCIYNIIKLLFYVKNI